MKPSELLTILGGLCGLIAGSLLTVFYLNLFWLIVTMYPSYIVGQLLVVISIGVCSIGAKED